MIFNELANIINNITGYTNKITFATNSIKIGWYKSEQEKPDYFFWVDPPWRIIKNNSIIINSFNYPYHSNYSEDERKQEELDFRNWCSAIDFMRDEYVSGVKFSNFGDLKIIWKNGCELDEFVNDIESASCYFYDYISWLNYLILPGRIEIEHMKKKDR